MKNFTLKILSSKFLFSFAFILMVNVVGAQVKQPFSARYSQAVNGDFTMIANNVLSTTATGNENSNINNHDVTTVFVDIDSDSSTFNSSSANLVNPQPSSSCLQLNKAFLYWSGANKEYDATTGNGGTEPNWDFRNVKLMLPGSSTYITVTADDVIYDGRATHFVNDPYTCFKDITSNVQALADPFGKFQVANVKVTEGDLQSHIGNNTGTSGGWQIIFIYESPSLERRNITLFDGYAQVTATDNSFDIDFNGFQTVPNGAVNANILIGSTEGDRNIAGDALQILDTNNSWTGISTIEREEDNFFNSKITLNGSQYLNRSPASTNTLGFDAGIFQLKNDANQLIDNNQTSAKLRMTSNQETYGLYTLGLSIEIFEPSLGALNFTTSTGTTSFNPGDTVPLQIGLKNVGNDNVNNLEITTTLPEQVDFVDTDPLPPGVTYAYNSSTKELKFFVQDGYTDVNDPLYTINYNVLVKSSCNSCSAETGFQATATFIGETNPTPVTVLSSGTVDTCGIGDHLPTNITIIPNISIDNASADEGNDMTFTVTSSHLLTSDLTINLTYSDVTTITADYNATITTINIPANSNSTTFSVTAIDDNWRENDQTFHAIISTSSTSVTLLKAIGIGTIHDTDTATVSIGNYDFLEDAGTVQLRIWLADTTGSAGVEEPFTVDVALALESATPDSDYSNFASTTVSFSANSLPGTEFFIPFEILDDVVTEPSEQVGHYFSDNSSAGLVNLADPGMIRIHDNDIATVALQDITVNEEDGTINYAFTLNGEVQDPFIMDFATADNSAIQPTDYIVNSGTVNFTGTDGEVNTINIDIVDNSIIEPSEDFIVNASYTGIVPSEITNGLAQNIVFSNNPGTITISDDDLIAGTGISFSDTNIIVTEGMDAFARFTVTLTGDISENVSVDFITNDGTAIDGDDMTAQSGTIIFTPTDKSFNIDIPILNDGTIEPQEAFTVVLSNIQSNIGIGFVDGDSTNTANGTINDDDLGSGNGISFVNTDVEVTEGTGVTAVFEVTLTGSFQEAFDLSFETAFGTADGTDLVARTGVLAFDGNDGETRTITVTILDDDIIEPTEGYNIDLTGTTNPLVAINTPQANGSILDNDGGAGTGISFDNDNITVNEDAGTIIFNVVLAGNVAGGFTLDYATGNGSANAPGDYTAN
ncbi:Calx-beta domain-containing protein, partial [Maribacter sp. 2304DJ31-5]|uniref:Calx-beta domain-containing protein n=1 Tax=Maribacter sp. 2304DJ31-5 TaxID=3386273 RepID=UPI0039BC4B77